MTQEIPQQNVPPTPIQEQIDKQTGVNKPPEITSMNENYRLDETITVIDDEGRKHQLPAGTKIFVPKI